MIRHSCVAIRIRSDIGYHHGCGPSTMRPGARLFSTRPASKEVPNMFKGFIRILPALMVLAASCAMAQTYPSRPIRLVVPFAAGGPADFLGRVIGQKLGEALGAQI